MHLLQPHVEGFALHMLELKGDASGTFLFDSPLLVETYPQSNILAIYWALQLPSKLIRDLGLALECWTILFSLLTDLVCISRWVRQFSFDINSLVGRTFILAEAMHPNTSFNPFHFSKPHNDLEDHVAGQHPVPIAEHSSSAPLYYMEHQNDHGAMNFGIRLPVALQYSQLPPMQPSSYSSNEVPVGST